LSATVGIRVLCPSGLDGVVWGGVEDIKTRGVSLGFGDSGTGFPW